jgi:hypothetical protein
MTDQYTAQRYIAGVSAGGHLRSGVLVCGMTRAANGGSDIAYPVQWLESNNLWVELFKRYPRNQVIRLPDVDVQYREIKHYRKWQKSRCEE